MRVAESVRELFLLLARVAVGVVFVAHGAQKVFTWGIDGTASAFGSMGIPLPTVSAWASALIELVGGLALIAGVGLPLTGVLLALNMLGALYFAHLGKGFFVTAGGYEYVLVLATVSLALGLQGGRYTLDEYLSGSRREPAKI